MAKAKTKLRRMNMEDDPVLSSFMSFLAAEIQRSPERITPLDPGVIWHIGTLVSDVNTSPGEELTDEALV